MEPVFDFGLEATRWLHATYPQLKDFLAFISELGTEEFYLAILPLIFWCLDKRLGKHLAYIFLFSTAFNALFKHGLRGPRPYWLDSSVGLATSEDYGVPSGHTQLATTVYLFVAAWIKRGWVWTAAWLMVLLMGLSRIYLGVHFVHDVLVGFLLALIILLGYFLWQRYFAHEFDKRILGQKLLAAIVVPAVFASIYTIVRLIIGQPNLDVSWVDFMPEAELAGNESMATAVGALLGMGTGITLEARRVRFLVDGPVWKRVLRYLLGIVVTVAIWGGLKEIFPADPLWLAIPLRIFRYFLALLWVGYYGPMVFVRLHLAEAEPDPGINLTM